MSTSWVIRPWPQPAEVWAAVVETEANNRRSLDQSKVLLKWHGETPAILQLDPQYTHAGIRAILAGPDWSDPDPPTEDP